MNASVTPGEANGQVPADPTRIDQAMEGHRDGRGVSWLEALLQDVRFGFRVLRKSRPFLELSAAQK
jgi:hypothetical protein